MGNPLSNRRPAARIFALMTSSVILLCAQHCGLLSGAPASEQSIAVSVESAPPLKQLPARRALESIASVMPYSVPALDQNDIYFVSTEGRIVKRDVVAHANRWTFGGAAPFSDVIVSNNRVYVTGPNSTIVARDKNSGKLIWSRDIPGDGNVRLSMIRGMLFARSESVTRLDPVNGAVLWRAQTGRVDKVVAPASVFAAIAEGSPIQESISVIDSASGRIVAEYNPGGPAGIARILEAQGDAVLVHAAATGATIDEDGYALTKLVWLDSVTGQMMRSWSYRPDAKSHGPDTMIATPI